MAHIREAVAAWRDADDAGASPTSRALLAWWFATDHLAEQADGSLSQFRYYFAQREAAETVNWLYDVRNARDKHDLCGTTHPAQFRPTCSMRPAAVRRQDGQERRQDFDGLRIFFNNPVLPDNGHTGQNWREDFQIALHIQDDVRIVRLTGNLFLTNIHRVYPGEVAEPSLEDDDLRDHFLQPFRPPACRQNHRQQCGPGRDRPGDRQTRGVQRRGTPHPQPQAGLVQVDPGHPPPDAAEGPEADSAVG